MLQEFPPPPSFRLSLLLHMPSSGMMAFKQLDQIFKPKWNAGHCLYTISTETTGSGFPKSKMVIRKHQKSLDVKGLEMEMK